MNGSRLLADTNIFINISEGKVDLSNYLDENDIFISIISEIELLGFRNISIDESNYFKAIIDQCFSIEVIPQIKEITISLKKKYKIKLPDAVIAATAIFLEIPLITFDKGFSEIEELELFLLN
jgi:predicted nucleic acid-binding protein